MNTTTTLLAIGAPAICALCYLLGAITGERRGIAKGWCEHELSDLDRDYNRRRAIRRHRDGTFAEKGVTR